MDCGKSSRNYGENSKNFWKIPVNFTISKREKAFSGKKKLLKNYKLSTTDLLYSADKNM